MIYLSVPFCAQAGGINGAAQISAYEEAVASNKDALRTNKYGYERGIKLVSDVLNAQYLLFTSLRDLKKARIETAFQGLKLKAAVGSLSEADLREISRKFTAVDSDSIFVR